MKLHLWNGDNSRTWCGRGHFPGIAVAKVRKIKRGLLVEHCADDLPDIVCGTCRKGIAKRIGWGWWWKRVGGGKWTARRLSA